MLTDSLTRQTFASKIQSLISILAIGSVSCLLATAPTQAQALTTLVNFDSYQGNSPKAGLVQGSDGNFYGTTAEGGSSGGGTVFKMTPSGALTTLVNFGYSYSNNFFSNNGASPTAGLVQGSDGNFYGTTTFGGGIAGSGTVFKMTPTGLLTTLVTFDMANGAYPYAGLIQGSDGDFYGTTSYGGEKCTGYSDLGCGTVFKMTPSGALTTLFSFLVDSATNTFPNGYFPTAKLVQGSDSNFYSTTVGGGSSEGGGAVFKMTPTGVLTTLVNFDYDTNGNFLNGANPYAGLIQGSDGNFYGTTTYGGSFSSSCPVGCGTVFKMTPTGVLTTLVKFNLTNGALPYAELVQGNDGNFYGTTEYGGSFPTICSSGCGTVFKMTPTSVLTTLVNFTDASGANPYAGLVQGSDGKLYGTTISLFGTVFNLALPVAPTLTSFRPLSGSRGSRVEIIGTDLAGASVKFNNTSATLSKVEPPTQVNASVPCDATSGLISVTTDLGTATSAEPFIITAAPLPSIASFTPASGAVGKPITITGTNFGCATQVRFNNTATTAFKVTVVSGKELKVEVPSGATTGKISVIHFPLIE